MPVGLWYVDYRQWGVRNEKYICRQHFLYTGAQGFQQFLPVLFLHIYARHIDQRAYPPVTGSFYNGSIPHGITIDEFISFHLSAKALMIRS